MRYFPDVRLQGIKKITKRSQSEKPVSGAIFEPMTSRIQKRSVNKTNTIFDNNLFEYRNKGRGRERKRKKD
jgi:hypothetical protein